MTAEPTTLFSLFGEFSDVWPTHLIREELGAIGPGTSLPDPEEVSVWLGFLNGGADLFDIRTGAAGDRVSVEAKLTLDNARTGYPKGFPFVIASMPDVEFRILTIGGIRFVQLFASVSDRGAEVVLEGLPVEIRLPIGLVAPHPKPDDHPPGVSEITVGTFPRGPLDGPPASHDDLEISYQRDLPTSIFVHIRLHINEDGGITVRPIIPISFGKCLFADLPCLAVHDFNLFPSPERVPETVEWIRHSVLPFVENAELPFVSEPYNGLFAVRSVHLDPTEEPIKDIATRLNGLSETASATEFVLDDVVVPFFSPYIIPIPRHITIGIRRRIEDPTESREIFTLKDAPVKFHLYRDPPAAFIIEALFYKSLPFEEIEEDSGVRFSAGLVYLDRNSFGDPPEPPVTETAFIFSLAENWTIRMAYRRGFTSATGLPAPGEGEKQVFNSIFHLEIATIQIDLMGMQVGYSLGRAIAEGASFLDSAELTVDLFVFMPPTGDDDSFFKLRALDGEKVAFALEGVGCRQGSLHLDGISLPDGVIAMFGPFGIIIHEIGLLAEQGASYLSFDAGVILSLPKSFEGAIVVRRLRFRIAGNEDAPFFKLDGIFARIKAGTFLIEGGGYYTQTQEGGIRVSEIGGTLKAEFKLSSKKYTFGIDILWGSVESMDEEFEEFDYFLLQVFVRGSVPLGSFELRGVRFLFADNVQPKLEPVDKDSQDLRYYNWFKTSDPINVPGDRRLAAWQPQNNARAYGGGLSGSIASLGKAVELSIFVLYVDSDDENGLLIVGDVRALKNPNPLGFIAIESDGKSNRFSMVIGVELTAENFLDDPPNWVKKIGQLTGTIFISNDPGTFAIGRLNDQRTWFGARWETDLFVRTLVLVGVCLELVEDGPKGFAFVVRLEGEIDVPHIFTATFNAEIGFLAVVFSTGSTDYATAFSIALGLRTKLFGFLRFGISAVAEFRVVGTRPSRGELEAQLRFETPWYLPDVTWTFECVFGDLDPAGLATSVTPLRIAAAVEGLSRNSLPVHVERFDRAWNGEGTTQTFSINAFRAGGASEADRLDRFENNTEIRPIATDATIEVEWSVAVNDQLSLDPNAATNLGDQSSGDLALTYDLVEIAVRRRARFGSDLGWHPLEERVELQADFSDPDGVDLNGSFQPQSLTKFWDQDVQIEGETATKKLFINARSPFEFITRNPEVDEELVRNNPSWPCCDPKDKKKPRYKTHEVIFRNELLGIDLDTPRLFTESQSRLSFMRLAYVRPRQFGTAIPPNSLVAYVATQQPGPVFRAELDEDAAFCFIRLGWVRAPAILQLLAFDASGEVVASKDIPLAYGGDFQTIILPGQGPIRRLEARIMMRSRQEPVVTLGFFPQSAAALEVDRVAYIGLRDYLDNLRFLDACSGTGDDSANGYEGRGKLFFLPNHEYEFALTTRITVEHPSKPSESADVSEYVYFKTKGLPGLNAVQRTGEEIEPYVNSAYAGGRGFLYREEPVVLAFKDDFQIAVPITLRPPGTAEEHSTLLRMQLLVQPETAAAMETPYTATDEDWVVANRVLFEPIVATIWKAIPTNSQTKGTSTINNDPSLVRLATLTQRAEVRCDLDDPRNVIGTVLIAPPQGTTDPDDPSKELWPGTTRFVATVRPQGISGDSSSVAVGFVDRRGFEPADKTAFTFSLDETSGGAGAWSVVDGELHVEDGEERRFALFGEPTWNYLQIQVSFKLDNASAGIGVALPAGGLATRGLFAMVEHSEDGLNLSLYRRESGVQFQQLDQVALPESPEPGGPITLRVTAFDDRLRASVGDAILEVERDEFREGRLCLVAQGGAQFTSLEVTGLDMFAFPFATSRFTSFEDHIESFSGILDVIEPDNLGDGTTTSTVATLWSETRDKIRKEMQPAGDHVKRQELFNHWVAGLGLPLKDEITHLEISRFVVENRTEIFLLESPEPLDFTEEVTLELFKRRFLPDFPGKIDFVGSELLVAHREKPVPDKNRTETEIRAGKIENFARIRAARRRLRDDLVLSEKKAGSILQPGDSVAEREDNSQPVILDVVRKGNSLRIELDVRGLIEQKINEEKLVFAEVVRDDLKPHLKFYSGSVGIKSGGQRAVVLAKATDEIIVLQKNTSFLVAKILATLEPGEIAGLIPDLTGIFDIFRPLFSYKPIDVRVLQDGSSRHALVIPIEENAAVRLLPGSYRMAFTMDRQRWQTTEPPDELNRYRKTATLSFGM